MDDYRESRFWSGKGGTVEPGDRSALVRTTTQRLEAEVSATGPRFELRDATTDLVYHAKSFDEMVVKADRVGALRFTAIDAQGQRSFVQKADGGWQRPSWVQSAEPARDRNAMAAQRMEAGKGTAKVVPLTAAAPTVQADAPVAARTDADAE